MQQQIVEIGLFGRELRLEPVEDLIETQQSVDVWARRQKIRSSKILIELGSNWWLLLLIHIVIVVIVSNTAVRVGLLHVKVELLAADVDLGWIVDHVGQYVEGISRFGRMMIILDIFR